MNESNTAFETIKQEIEQKKLPSQGTSEPSHEEGSDDREAVQDERAASKKIKFNKGEQFWDLDEDASIEFMADKKPVKMTVKEMRDAAAGGVAVRNRLREVAEEKKRVGAVFKSISDTAKNDPIKALQLMMSKVSEIDPEMTYHTFMKKFGEQARQLANMDPKEHKVWELERQLEEKQQHIRAQEMEEKRYAFENRTGMSSDLFDELATHIVEDPEIAKDIKNEDDLIEKVGELYAGIQLHQVSKEILQKVDASISPRSPIIHEFSRIIAQNPDFTEKDLLEVASGASKYSRKGEAERYYSNKQRTSTSEQDYIESGLSNFEVIKRQIEQRKRLKKAS